MSRRRRIYFIAALALGGCLSGQAATVSAGEIVQFSFTLGSPPTCPDGACDTFLMTPFGATSVFVGSPVMHVQLFDGNTLLGAFTGVPVVASFVSSASQYTFGNPTVIDFSSILNGSIHGIVDYQLTGGSITNTSLDPALAEFSLGHAISSNGFNATIPITVSSEIVVPEPGMAAPVFACFAAMVCCALRRRNRQQVAP